MNAENHYPDIDGIIIQNSGQEFWDNCPNKIDIYAAIFEYERHLSDWKKKELEKFDAK